MGCVHDRICSHIVDVDGKWTWSIPPRTRDAFLLSILVLPLAYTNIRAPVATRVLAIDSTRTTGGACVADVRVSVVRALYRRAEHCGSRVQVDDSDEPRRVSRLGPLSQSLDHLVLGMPWRAPRTFEFNRVEHVNLQEIKASQNAVLAKIRRGARDCRQALVNDSQVTVGATAKGRSSSKQINKANRTSRHFPLFWSKIALRPQSK